MEAADDSHIGFIGNKSGGTKEKKNQSLPIIGSVFDNYVYILKYTIIQYIITIVNQIIIDIKNPPATPTPPLPLVHLDELHNALSKYINTYKEVLNINNMNI